MTPAAKTRMLVYQEGQRSAHDESAVCPYTDWRALTWLKGRTAALEYFAELEERDEMERAAPQQSEPPALPADAREAMRQALDALENAIDQTPKPYSTECARSADALREALEGK
jgi:hypothetical protein